MEQTQYHTTMGKVDIMTRVICTLFCVGVLIPAAITLPAIDEVEDTADDYGIEYKDTASYRVAAGFLLFMSSAAILYHVLAIIIRILYISSAMEKYFTLYVYTSAILCVFFMLSLLSGGVASSIFAADNGKLWTNNCLHVSFHRSPFCQNLQRITDSEAASAAMSFLSMIIFGILFLIMIGGHLAIMYKSDSQEEPCPSPLDVPPPYDSLHPPSYESALTMSYAPVDTSSYEPDADTAP